MSRQSNKEKAKKGENIYVFVPGSFFTVKCFALLDRLEKDLKKEIGKEKLTDI